MFSLLIVGSLVGAALMSGNEKSVIKKDSRQAYTKELVRENLTEWAYDNWDCEHIAYELQDNWLRDDFESLMRRGYSFQEAIDKLINEGKLKRR